MHKVLIIWLGRQWQKYIDYFLKNNYEVYWVCRTQETRKNIENKYKIKASLNYMDFVDVDFHTVIIALPPAIQWKIWLEVAGVFRKSTVVIEIPVSFDMDDIQKLCHKDNVLFFMEEHFTLLANFLSKIDLNEIDRMDIKLFIDREDLDNQQAVQVAYIHLLNNFYWLDMDLSKLHIEMETHNQEDIFYEVHFMYGWKKIAYIFNKEKWLYVWDAYLADKYNFDFAVSNILKMKKMDKDYYLKIWDLYA